MIQRVTKEENKKFNDLVRGKAGAPDLVEDKEWRVWKSTPQGAFWYIPVEDDHPSDDNIIEGETGDLMYLDFETAHVQWYGTEP